MDLILEGFGLARIAFTWKGESTQVRFLFLFPGGPGKAHATQSTQEGWAVSDSLLLLHLIALRCGVAPSPCFAASFCKGALTHSGPRTTVVHVFWKAHFTHCSEPYVKMKH